MSSEDELIERSQNNHSQDKNHSLVMKRKKRVQFLEDEDSTTKQSDSSSFTNNKHKKSKHSSHEKSHQKEFLESVLFHSDDSSDSESEQEPITTTTIPDSPLKNKQQPDTETNVEVNTTKDDTLDHYTRNILNRMDFSDSDDMDDFIEHDESMVTNKRTIRDKPHSNKSLVAKRKNRHGDSQIDRSQRNNDRSYRLALDVFGDDFHSTTINNYHQTNNEEYVSDDSEKLYDGDDDRTDYSQSTAGSSNRRNNTTIQKSIHELYEPEELERQFLTTFDDVVRSKDVPERFQLRSNAVRSADDDELEKEAKWIYDNFIGTPAVLLTCDKRDASSNGPLSHENNKKVAPIDHIAYIKIALDLIRNELCEVPFIHMYRHENINGVFNEDELWTIYKADNKWCSFSNKIKQFKSYLKRFQNYQSSPHGQTIKFHYRITDHDLNYLEDDVDSESEFFHFYKKMQFYNGTYKNDFLIYESNNAAADNAPSSSSLSNDIAVAAPQKEPRSFNRHHFYVSKDIGQVVDCFGLRSSQLDENIRVEYQRHKPLCYGGGSGALEESPIDVARKYVSSVFDSCDKVIDAAVDMYTLEVSHEQHLLRYIHQLFLKHARLNVSPTVRGMEEIDESHVYCSFKYIANKPVKGITSEMMLKLDQANIEKLLNVKIGLPEHIISELLDYIKSFQINDNTNNDAAFKFNKEWSDLRCLAIEKAILNHCLPLIERDTYQKLLGEAQSDLTKRCGEVFKNHLICAPFNTELKSIHSSTTGSGGGGGGGDPFDNNTDLPLIMVISVPTLASTAYSPNVKKQHKYVNVKSVNGNINHPSVSTNKIKSHTYADDDNNSGRGRGRDDDDELNNSNIHHSNTVSSVIVPNDSIGYVVVMDDCGETIDYVSINNAILHPPKYAQNKHNDSLRLAELSFKKIEKMLTKYTIGGVFIPLRGREYNYLAEKLQSRIQRMAAAASDINVKPNVHLVNPYISDRLMKVMTIQLESNKKLEYERAISIGRYALDPLVACANLFVHDSHSLTFLNDLLLPYQRYLDVDKVRGVLEEKLVSIVNEIGVDLNKASSIDWYSSVLQFVCGFGARKAQRLLTDIRCMNETGRLNNRTQLVTMCNLGPKIFINSAGFLKIEGSIANEEGDINLLDATRIHPELYDWTRKIMIDALDIEETAGAATTSKNNHHMESIKKYDYNEMLITLRNDPTKLKELDLDVFAEELIRQGIALNKKYSLELITIEMLKEFPDYRARFHALTSVEKFWILANGGSRIDICETLEYSTLSSKHPSELSRFHNEDLVPVYAGKFVSFVATSFICRRPDQDDIAKAVPEKDIDSQLWKCPFCFEHVSNDLKVCWDHIENACEGNAVAVSGILESFYGAITAVINLAHVSDNPPKSIKERVTKSMHITCVVLNLKLDRLSVDLTCRSSDLCDKPNNCLKFKRDAYYDTKAEEQQRQLKKEHQEQLKKQVVYQQKLIIHPSFKNVTFTEAEKLLDNNNSSSSGSSTSAPIGDCIIRPSSKGVDHLTVTWKVYDGIYHHIDIVEKDKSNFFSLGKKLWIKNECYEDLDEIIARHIEPMSALMKEATQLKVFNYAEGGSRHKMASILSDEKKINPLRIPYLFSPSKIYPGKLLLGFLPRHTPLFEYVSIVPEGVKFRDIIHSSFDDLIKWFKLNFNQLAMLNSVYPTAAAAANKTPNSYHNATTTTTTSGATDSSISPLSGAVNTKVGFKNTQQPTTSLSSHQPPTMIHGYAPSSNSGFSKN